MMPFYCRPIFSGLTTLYTTGNPLNEVGRLSAGNRLGVVRRTTRTSPSGVGRRATVTAPSGTWSESSSALRTPRLALRAVPPELCGLTMVSSQAEPAPPRLRTSVVTFKDGETSGVSSPPIPTWLTPVREMLWINGALTPLLDSAGLRTTKERP
jgi:hypothetical protein